MELKQKKIPVDLIVPFYNPPHNWDINLLTQFSKIEEEFPQHKFHLILVNDGSPINIKKEIENVLKLIPNCHYISYNTNFGKGYAIRKGLHFGVSEYTMYTDIDFPYNIESVKNVLNNLVKHKADVVVSKRKTTYYSTLNLQRTLISKLTQAINRYILRLPITDTQAGLKAFNSKGKNLLLYTKSNRFIFDLEFIKNSFQNKLNIKTANVELREGVTIKHLKLVTLLREVPDFLKIMLL